MILRHILVCISLWKIAACYSTLVQMNTFRKYARKNVLKISLLGLYDRKEIIIYAETTMLG